MPTETPLLSYLRMQRALDRDVLASLRSAAASVDAELRRLQGRTGIGAEMRSAQLAASQAEINRAMQAHWSRVGNLTAAAQAGAAADAAEAAFRSSSALSKMFDPTDVDYMTRSVRASAAQNVANAMERVSGTSYVPLAESVYENAALTSGKIDDLVTSALARGASAAELARDVREYVNPNTPGGVRYASNRLARTELNNAFHASQVRQAQANPWTLAMLWNLSGSHPVPDECNVYAEDTHFEGGEAGQFRPTEVPGKPHPNCLCYMTTVDVSEDEFIKQFESGQYDSYLDDLGLPPDGYERASAKMAEWGGEKAYVDPAGGKALKATLDDIAPTPPRPTQPWLQDTFDFTQSQRAGDPNVAMIAARGLRMDGSSALRNHGIDGECHWNTSALFDKGEVDEIVIGYVHNAEVGWIQHTWGRKGGRIVETNYSVRADTYFGVPLSPEEAKSFAEWCRVNRPGMGRVRRASDA